MKTENLKELLKDSVVNFTFRKKNGEIREAIGTRCLDIAEGITENDIPKGVKEEIDSVITFWDCEKHAWRSCIESSVISIDKVVPKIDIINIPE